MPTAADLQHIEFTRHLDAAPEAAFDRLTNPAHLRAWFAEHVEIEPRVGGAYRFWGRHTPLVPTPSDAAQRLTRFDPGHALRYEWYWGGNDTEVLIELSSDANAAASAARTKLWLRHTLIDGTVAGYSRTESDFFSQDFWCVALANLREHLRSGKPAIRPDFADPSDTARVSIEIDAPRERVWHALTDAREMDKWLSKTGVAEPLVGGAYSYGWNFDGCTCGPTKILEMEPPHRLVHDWFYEPDGARGGASRTEWVLDALSPTRTRVTITQFAITSPRNHTGYTGGWAKFAVALKDLVEAA